MTPAAAVSKMAIATGKDPIVLAVDLAKLKSTNSVSPNGQSLIVIGTMADQSIGKRYSLTYEASGKSMTRSGIFQGIEYDESSRRFMVCFEIIRNEKIKSLKVAVHDLTDLKADDCTNGGGYC